MYSINVILIYIILRFIGALFVPEKLILGDLKYYYWIGGLILLLLFLYDLKEKCKKMKFRFLFVKVFTVFMIFNLVNHFSTYYVIQYSDTNALQLMVQQEWASEQEELSAIHATGGDSYEDIENNIRKRYSTYRQLLTFFLEAPLLALFSLLLAALFLRKEAAYHE